MDVKSQIDSISLNEGEIEAWGVDVQITGISLLKSSL
jgi:hypothetical protein